MSGDEDEWAQVVVVGFGAAGACAAIEAAATGADVLVLDRFDGGGATALSGGVIYAGGGTAQQREAGVSDTPEAMYDYLRAEVGDAVSAATLRRFCADSVPTVEWLSELGVPFEGSLCPDKTSYPGNRHYLYYSGSESAGGFRDLAAPAPRGHRAKGRGISGTVLFTHLAAAARRHGVRVLPSTRVEELITDADGRVVGLTARTLRGAPGPVRLAHRMTSRYAAKPGIYLPPLRRLLHRWAAGLERRYSRPLRVHAEHGVVLCAGGFVANRDMLRRHAPAYRGGLALGTTADDGSGIRLGTEVGAATAHLDRVSAWRFITPPTAFLRGLLVDQQGRRICDESRYGAALGHAMVEKSAGRGFLLLDQEILRLARRQLPEQTVWFQRLQAEYLLRTAVTADTVAGVAARAGIAVDGLESTVAAHNTAAQDGRDDPMGKPAEFVQPLTRPPYALLDVSIRPSLGYPCPMLTLGGLVVDEETGAVRDGDGRPIAGLYAAGRSAVGICSNSYVSGLSLADCVFSGRRAGRNVLKGAGGC